MIFCSFFKSKYVPFEHLGLTLYLWGQKVTGERQAAGQGVSE
jgi:hypothetical protein